MDDVTRIIIADDHPIFREGLARTIERDRRYAVIGEVSDGAEALRLIRELHPDIAVLDISMPTMDGLEVARQVHRDALATELVMLTMYKEAKYFDAALDMGVRGYVLKDSAAVELLLCLEAVTSGQHYLSPAVAHLLVERTRTITPHSDATPIRHRLTPAELTIMRLISENRTSREIAERLFVSLRTVENHRMHICQKLGLKGHDALLHYARENTAAP